jgi:hypothetical protein
MRFQAAHKQNELKAEAESELIRAEFIFCANIEQLIICRAIHKNCSTLWTVLFAFVSV